MVMSPLRLRVEGISIPGWKLEKKRALVIKRHEWTKTIKGNIQFTPAMPGDALRKKAKGKPKVLELVPLGETSLRLTWLPVVA